MSLIAGEDGQIKIWSKSGMLRSTLANQGKAKDPCFTSLNLSYIFLWSCYLWFIYDHLTKNVWKKATRSKWFCYTCILYTVYNFCLFNEFNILSACRCVSNIYTCPNMISWRQKIYSIHYYTILLFFICKIVFHM